MFNEKAFVFNVKTEENEMWGRLKKMKVCQWEAEETWSADHFPYQNSHTKSYQGFN